VNESSPASGRLADSESGGPDVILAVEGTAVRTVDELRNALRDRKPGEIVTLRVYNAPSKVRRVERVRLGGDAR
jgi:S1-C subfamily serine protease